MSFLDKLLDGVGVEWRAFGELTLPTNKIKWRDLGPEIGVTDALVDEIAGQARNDAEKDV